MKEGWRMVKLGEVCEIRPSRSQNFKKLKDTDKVSFLPMEDLGVYDRVINASKTKILKEVSGSYTYFENGDVLLAKVTPCFENGKLGIAYNLINGIGFGSSEYIVFRPSNIINSEYVYYNLANAKFREGGKRLMLGACGLKRLSKDYVNNYKIPLPPLEEQHRIVSILDASFEKIDALKKNAEENLKNAKALFQQVLAQELKPKEGWVEKKLGEIADFVRGPFGGSLTKSIFKESGYAVYEQQHAIHHHVNIRYFIDENKFDEMKRFEVKPGDLIMSCSGTIGEVYIIPLDAPVGVINQALLKLSVSSQLDRCYFKSWLESPIFKEIILKYSKGAAIPNVPGVKILKDINIVLPPLEEQHRIVRTLDTLSEKCRRLEEVAQQTIRECDALKQSILRQAFSGEL